jgi:hypothetical protein
MFFFIKALIWGQLSILMFKMNRSTGTLNMMKIPLKSRKAPILRLLSLYEIKKVKSKIFNHLIVLLKNAK